MLIQELWAGTWGRIVFAQRDEWSRVVYISSFGNKGVSVMRISVITAVIAFSTIYVNGGYSGAAQLGGTSDTKPEVALVVNMTELTVNRQDGRIQFQVDAMASEGFTGTISGTITVSQPTNPSGVHLTKGSDSKTFKFTLAAGQKTWKTTPPQTGAFT